MFLYTNLKHLRDIKGLTQEQVANDLNIKDSALRRYENAVTKNPGILIVIALAEYFNIDINTLLFKDLSKD